MSLINSLEITPSNPGGYSLLVTKTIQHITNKSTMLLKNDK